MWVYWIVISTDGLRFYTNRENIFLHYWVEIFSF